MGLLSPEPHPAWGLLVEACLPWVRGQACGNVLSKPHIY